MESINQTNWQLLTSVGSEFGTLPIFALLQENNIPYETLNKKDSEILIGEIEIYVPQEFLEEAKELISNIN